jgi:hypothetical protein
VQERPRAHPPRRARTPSADQKLDQILKRLEKIEQRLNQIEKIRPSGNPPIPPSPDGSPAVPDKPTRPIRLLR